MTTLADVAVASERYRLARESVVEAEEIKTAARKNLQEIVGEAFRAGVGPEELDGLFGASNALASYLEQIRQELGWRASA